MTSPSEGARKRKPKYEVGQRVWCCICGIPVTITAVSKSGNRVKLSCLMNGKFTDCNPATELRPLTKREAGR